MPHVASRDEWLKARLDLLDKEKDLQRRRDKLAKQRRELPWVKLDKEYTFRDATGAVTLADLFDGHSQLLVYHFMFGPDWEEGCPSCSFWADSFEGNVVHLAHRDVAFACVSRAPIEELESYRKRMGWTFPWVLSLGGDFNFDFFVSFTEDRNPGEYNYRAVDGMVGENPGLSAFAMQDGTIYHTYSCYSRGLDPINSAYQLLDLAPKGRDEDGLEWPMAWLRRHDQYDA